jgi:hypothetical protein
LLPLQPPLLQLLPPSTVKRASRLCTKTLLLLLLMLLLQLVTAAVAAVAMFALMLLLCNREPP